MIWLCDHFDISISFLCYIQFINCTSLDGFLNPCVYSTADQYGFQYLFPNLDIAHSYPQKHLKYIRLAYMYIVYVCVCVCMCCVYVCVHCVCVRVDRGIVRRVINTLRWQVASLSQMLISKVIFCQTFRQQWIFII